MALSGREARSQKSVHKRLILSFGLIPVLCDAQAAVGQVNGGLVEKDEVAA
jgi:hypothetical protein